MQRRSSRIAKAYPRRSGRLATLSATSEAISTGVSNVTSPSKKHSRKRGGRSNIVTPPAKKRKTGPHSIENETSATGVVDPESKIIGMIEVLDHSPCDVMLVLVDPQKNMDKFFILQLIQCTAGGHAVYSRWGRTGTCGQGLEKRFDNYDDAVKCFKDKFQDKVGLVWEDRTNPTVGGKYRFIQQNFVEKQHGYTGAKWQYWVDDGVDGKATDWYDYAPSGSVMVEQLFHEKSINPRLKNVSIVILLNIFFLFTERGL